MQDLVNTTTIANLFKIKTSPVFDIEIVSRIPDVANGTVSVVNRNPLGYNRAISLT